MVVLKGHDISDVEEKMINLVPWYVQDKIVFFNESLCNTGSVSIETIFIIFFIIIIIIIIIIFGVTR